jgi:hypothetical protein
MITHLPFRRSNSVTYLPRSTTFPDLSVAENVFHSQARSPETPTSALVPAAFAMPALVAAAMSFLNASLIAAAPRAEGAPGALSTASSA